MIFPNSSSGKYSHNSYVKYTKIVLYLYLEMKKSLDRELSLDAGFTALELVVVVVAILLLALVVVFI